MDNHGHAEGRRQLKLSITIGDVEFEVEGEATIAELLPALRIVFGKPEDQTGAQQHDVDALLDRLTAANDKLEARIAGTTPELEPRL